MAGEARRIGAARRGGVGCRGRADGGGPAARPSGSAAPPAPAAVLTQYCVTCHNDRLKTAGLVIDPAALGNAGASADRWEKVVRKLRTRAMPPAGSPRPDAAGYERVEAFLETALDRAEAALASETGGVALTDFNDLSAGVARAADRVTSYWSPRGRRSISGAGGWW